MSVFCKSCGNIKRKEWLPTTSQKTGRKNFRRVCEKVWCKDFIKLEPDHETRLDRLEKFCKADDRASLNDLNRWDLRMIDEFIANEFYRENQNQAQANKK